MNDTLLFIIILGAVLSVPVWAFINNWGVINQVTMYDTICLNMGGEVEMGTSDCNNLKNNSCEYSPVCCRFPNRTIINTCGLE